MSSMLPNPTPHLNGAKTLIRYFCLATRKLVRHRVPKGVDPDAYLLTYLQTYQPEPKPKHPNLIQLMLDNYASLNPQKRTEQSYRYACRKALAFRPDGHYTPLITQALAQHLLESGLHPASVKNVISCLRSLWLNLYTMEIVTGGNPFMIRLRLKTKSKTRFEPVSDEKVDALVADLETTAKPEVVNAVLIIANGAVRPGEFAKLKPEHYRDGGIEIPAEIAKSGRPRFVRLPPGLGYQPVDIKDVRQAIRESFAKFGIPYGRNGSSLYSLKHTVARRIYRESRSTEAVQAYCGHQSISSTEHYLRGVATEHGAGSLRRVV